MKTLIETDYVLWDKANDTLVKWSSNDNVVIFGNKFEAEMDCYGNEYVTKCTDLPKHHQEKLIEQINFNN
jgi:glutathionyl-hydroquinone reductase